MNKNIIVVCFALLAGVSNSFGQTNTVGEFNKYIAQNWVGDYMRIGQYKVKGSPYLLGESFPGSIKYANGKQVDNVKILYDLHNQKAGTEVNNTIFETDVAVDEFTISLPEKFGKQNLLFKNTSKYNGASLKNYFNVLEEGTKFSFLKLFKIKYVSDPSNMLDKDLKVFEQFYEYYVYNKTTKELTKVKLKQKDIAKELGDEDFVKGFAAKWDLDVSKEADMLKLIQGFNNK